MGKGWHGVVGPLVLLLLFTWVLAPVGSARAALPAEEEEHGTARGAGLEAASWILTVPYGAAKTAFALGGAVVGGFTYVLSGGNMEAAKTVWVTSMYGTYIIKPAHLKGEEGVRFLGMESLKPRRTEASALE